MQTGVVLSERYRLDAPLGVGGMGDVWRATDLRLHRTVAVKALSPALADDPTVVARFLSEARTMAALHHPNVVNVYDHGEDSAAVYLVMECVEGKSLSQLLDEVGRLDAAQTMPIIAEAAHALQAAHDAGIIHRDVKPANLLITPDNSVRLVDFGIARSASSTTLTGSHAVLGTARYMAPEQAMGRQVTPAADIYALGAVAYHCLAGRPPFEGESAVQVALHHVQDQPPPLPDDVPAFARALVERAMAKDPAQRFASAANLAAAASGQGVDTATLPEPVAVATGIGRNRKVMAGAGALAVAGLVALLMAMFSGDPLDTTPSTPLTPSGQVPSLQPDRGTTKDGQTPNESGAPGAPGATGTTTTTRPAPATSPTRQSPPTSAPAITTSPPPPATETPSPDAS